MDSFEMKPKKRSIRRHYKEVKEKRIKRIIMECGYNPSKTGYIPSQWDDEQNKRVYITNYVKHPSSSGCQKQVKKETSRKIRKLVDVPKKGNFHHKVIDYWWRLY